MSNIIVNLGRELGSGGREIGIKLSKRLGFSYYDKEIIVEAAKASGLSRECFEKADESTRHKFGSLFSFFGNFGFAPGGAMVSGTASSAAATGVGNCLCNDEIFKIQSDVIKELAKKSSAIFVGRCADFILRELDCFNVFITARKEYRLENIKREYQIDEKEALELIAKVDKSRGEYYNFYTDKIWGAAKSYDLCIDSSLFGVEKTAEILETIIRERYGLGV